MDQPSDVRNLSAHRPVGAPVVALRSPAQLRPDLRDVIEPIQRSFGQPQVVIREHTNNAVRWKQGERLNHLLEEACIRYSESEAVLTDTVTLSYRELDCRANQVARYLIEQGIQAGDRVGLLFEKSAETYIAMLAVMKVNAAYVPLDAAFPIERMRFILGDAEITAIVSMSAFSERLAALGAKKVFLDSAKRAIDAKSASRLTGVPRTFDPICYIIYTSGTTGNPKGVAIAHASICNFVRVAAELYGYAPGDRVYQGMTIAFDFSVEEIWVPLMAGATLVPARPGVSLIGDELADFLRDRAVTVLACCPTLLATIEQDLPKLRILLVGGEACPQNLVARWYRPGRRILNSYGPTEATVTATLTELKPDKPVTIGIPLSTYSIVILDPNEDKTVENGELGEIGIAGVGVALGYINRDELTMKKFIRDFLHIRNNPSGRIYRTGDLGRIDENGEIEYRGRIDTQVKIRGYRIELNEIEAVLLDLPQIAQAAVATFEPEEGVVELVAYYALKQGAELPRDEISHALRSKLPAYMVPAFLEELPSIPMTLSNKADHKRLPKPQLARFSSASTGYVPARTDNERILHAALCDVLRVDRVSTEHHFFDELGANSLMMARVCAAIRKNPQMSNVSMRDIYTNPTIARLAHHLDSSIEGFVATKEEPFHVPSNLAYYTCGALQAAFYAAYALFGLWVLDTGYDWTIAASGALELYARAVLFAAGSFVALTGISVVAKWLLIGRFKTGSIPIWSLAYFRFWVVKTMMRTSPVTVFTGTPIYNFYLRLMGAKIGRGVVITSRHGPVCVDLLAIGDNTILRKDTILLGYRAQSNFIHMAPVEIGANVFVGEASIIDIDTAMGDDTQLGHASSLQSGQRVPEGKRYHGSPAVETISDYCPIESKEIGAFRSAFYSSLELAALFLVAVPAPILGYRFWEQYAAVTGGSAGVSTLSLLGLSAVGFFGALVVALAAVYAIPRLCMLFLKPGVTYPAFGFHYLMQSIILRVSNSQFFCVLFGDSSVITSYMRYVGWNLNRVEQTGSNMGTNQRHDNPFLCSIGSGTMVSDGLSMMNTHMSATSFQLAESRIGDNNYLGNDIFYPPGGKTGANVLLGTKTMIPIDGLVRENVGLLGSPAFEIPRMVDRDRDMNAAIDEATRRARLRQKNRYNAVTAILFLVSRWLSVFAGLALWTAALASYDRFGVFALLAATAAMAAASIAFFVLVERASLRFRRLEPKFASIYDPYFWFHERHWKLSESPIAGLFTGTPFRVLLLRALGMQVGSKVFDCSRSITERTLTEVGDYANLNEGCVLQAHSLEEGVFKSDYIRLGSGCSVGPGAFVHYGVTMGDRVVLDADSFLMKGEVLDSHTGWRGNPAKLVRRAGSGRAGEPAAEARADMALAAE
ncbi:MAG: amino acid adenylation domain-containing protein [Alphaproteobacteria bacterium]|nr:MAG: amino acid adenylation domain-containing protein [Alphaproteobacteria bacterium]